MLILSEAIIDPPGSTVLILLGDYLRGDCQFPPGSNVDSLRGNHFRGDHQSPRINSVILSEAIVDPPRQFADFEQKLVSTSACLASQRTFPMGKSNEAYNWHDNIRSYKVAK